MRWLAGIVLFALGTTTAIFHTLPPTPIWLDKRASICESPSLSNSPGPEMSSTSDPSAARLRQYASKLFHSPWLFCEACGMMLLMRKVTALLEKFSVRSADGVIWPRSHD